MPRTKKTPATTAGASPKKSRKAAPKGSTATTADRGATSQPAVKTIDPKIVAAFASWKNGEQISTLAASAELKVKRSKLRRLFIQLAGGKPAFKALRDAGAGGSVEPFGGKRASGRVVGSIAPAHDDSKVQTISSMKASEGWTVRRVWKATSVDIEKVGRVPTRELVAMVHVSPDGEEYVEARASEPADLVYVASDFTRRLRRYDESKLGKKIAKQERETEKLVERGEHGIKRTRERKRKAKLARQRA